MILIDKKTFEIYELTKYGVLIDESGCCFCLRMDFIENNFIKVGDL